MSDTDTRPSPSLELFQKMVRSLENAAFKPTGRMLIYFCEDEGRYKVRNVNDEEYKIDIGVKVDERS